MTRSSVIALALVAGFSADVYAQSSGDLASGLARLRGEVESLSEDLRVAREDARSTTRSLVAQRQELAGEIRREELRRKQLAQASAKRDEALALSKERTRALLPTARRELKRVREVIAAGVPFRTKERLAEIDKLSEQLEGGLLGPEAVLARLWERVEDEIRLGAESGLYKQVIEVEGQEFLADVVRVGMIWLFFRTPDGRYGQLVAAEQGWKAALITGQREIEQMTVFFGSFEKQIRVGYFELPVRWDGGAQ